MAKLFCSRNLITRTFIYKRSRLKNFRYCKTVSMQIHRIQVHFFLIIDVALKRYFCLLRYEWFDVENECPLHIYSTPWVSYVTHIKTRQQRQIYMHPPEINLKWNTTLLHRVYFTNRTVILLIVNIFNNNKT